MNQKIGIIAAIVGVCAVIIGWNIYQHQQARPQTQSISKSSSNSSNSSSSSASQTSKKTPTESNKPLIVFFSRTGQNYGGSNLKIGNTHRIANFIAERTGGDLYEIVPAKDYPKTYDATTAQAQKEQQSNDRPKIKNKMPDVSKYETIFIGYPIWWSEPPMIVLTFLEQVDLKNKKVVPFDTNAGSGFGDSIEILKKAAPKSKFLEGFEIAGSEAAGAKNKVNSWLKSIGY
ncbi:flavodoxin [Xylocopilactobacillus apis]|uniref:Flavodoxin-like domain-containing protein n=1 Tax=Xylocopilactobacillus apis TaxID=2932183 RepID=A0AAU9D3F4_9LACO|nr:flavodoxin [Xylocopilactobacillus apis]BDR56825.1 hypothetical protein KIMC2_13870 [Xylocopilactobacillus apis]